MGRPSSGLASLTTHGGSGAVSCTRQSSKSKIGSSDHGLRPGGGAGSTYIWPSFTLAVTAHSFTYWLVTPTT